MLRLLEPKINFHFYELSIDNKAVVLLEISAAFRHPVQFKGVEFIRIGSYKKKLKDNAEKARELWRALDNTPFEREIAAENTPVEQVISLLDYPAYFDLLKLPLPEGRDGILSALEADEMIVRNDAGLWNITEILFAKKLSDFQNLRHKAMRVILYEGENKVKTIREQEGTKGSGLFNAIYKSVHGIGVPPMPYFIILCYLGAQFNVLPMLPVCTLTGLRIAGGKLGGKIINTKSSTIENGVEERSFTEYIET